VVVYPNVFTKIRHRFLFFWKWNSTLRKKKKQKTKNKTQTALGPVWLPGFTLLSIKITNNTLVLTWKQRYSLLPINSYKSPFTPQYSFLKFISQSRKKKGEKKKRKESQATLYFLDTQTFLSFRYKLIL
jgi:hypothetical protein